MFSNIHSLIFGKKHHHRNHNQTVDDSLADQSAASDNFVVVERKQVDDPDVTPELYPKIDPSGGNLPYGITPSLPDLKPPNPTPTKKEGTTVDFLHGVPFQLASYIDYMANEKGDKFAKFLQKTQDVLTEDMISEGYSYDFNLEERVLSEFET